MLIITNGDAAVGALKAAGIRAAYLPWRDVLHEGPVPGGLPLETLSRIRAQFMADRGWGDVETIHGDFARRNRRLANARHHREIVLWFEHDLYDQLQLVQILAWFASAPLDGATLHLICLEEFVSDVDAGVAPVRLQQREPVTEHLLALGTEAWRAFTAPDPRGWETLAHREADGLPFLAPAFRRLLEELPDATTGLSRSERQILEAVAVDEATPRAVFRACQRREEAAFMGDASFFVLVHGLANGPTPALTGRGGANLASPPPQPLTREWLDQRLELTLEGRALLDGAADWVHQNGVDRWLGGIHLASGSVWRWNAAAGCLHAPV